MAKKRKKWKPKAPGAKAGAAGGAGPVCVACQGPLEPEQQRTTCPGCERPLHPACWDQRSHCPAPGCGAVLADRHAPPGLLEFLRDFAHPLTAILLLAVVTLLFYVDAWAVPFLFDDAPVITRNQLMWQWDTWWDLFKQNPNRGLVNLTFLANFQLGNTPTVQGYDWRDCFWYHAVSLTFHVGNAALLYLLLRDLLRVRREVPRGLGPWVALAGAGLWALHPAHTMAVSYIAQRYAVMAGTAFLGTLVLYVRLRIALEERPGSSMWEPWALLRLCGVLAAAACTGLTKENATVVPLVVLAIEVLFFGGRRLRLAAIPFLAFGVGALVRAWAAGLLPLLAQGELGQFLNGFFPGQSAIANRWQYGTTQIVVVLRYLHLFFFPDDLTVEQNFPVEWEGKWGDVSLALVGHGLILALGVLLLLRRHRLLPLAIAWYYVTHLVESSFLAVILDPMVDHRMYIPTMLLPAALCVAAARAWPALVAWRPEARLGLPAVGVALALLLGLGTFVRNLAWSSAIGIWRDTIEKRPDCARAYSSLGMEYLYLEQWVDAIGPIEAALYLGPYHVEGWNNLGKAYLELKLWDPAELSLRRGIEVDRVAPSPNVPLCWNNLGLIYIQRADAEGDPEKRLRMLETASATLNQAAKEARRCGFDYEVAYINLSTAEWMLASADPQRRQQHAQATIDALDAGEKVATRRGGILPASGYLRLGLALAELGREAEAVLPPAQQNPYLPPGGPLERGLYFYPAQEELALTACRIALQAAQAHRQDAQAMAARAGQLIEPFCQAAASPSSAALLLSGQVAHAAGNVELAKARLKAGIAASPPGGKDVGAMQELLRLIDAGGGAPQ